jgi:hypothetical protein
MTLWLYIRLNNNNNVLVKVPSPTSINSQDIMSQPGVLLLHKVLLCRYWRVNHYKNRQDSWELQKMALASRWSLTAQANRAVYFTAKRRVRFHEWAFDGNLAASGFFIRQLKRKCRSNFQPYQIRIWGETKRSPGENQYKDGLVYYKEQKYKKECSIVDEQN